MAFALKQLDQAAEARRESHKGSPYQKEQQVLT
jgi:hypothetical protein